MGWPRPEDLTWELGPGPSAAAGRSGHPKAAALTALPATGSSQLQHGHQPSGRPVQLLPPPRLLREAAGAALPRPGGAGRPAGAHAASVHWLCLQPLALWGLGRSPRRGHGGTAPGSSPRRDGPDPARQTAVNRWPPSLRGQLPGPAGTGPWGQPEKWTPGWEGLGRGPPSEDGEGKRLRSAATAARRGRGHAVRRQGGGRADVPATCEQIRNKLALVKARGRREPCWCGLPRPSGVREPQPTRLSWASAGRKGRRHRTGPPPTPPWVLSSSQATSRVPPSLRTLRCPPP